MEKIISFLFVINKLNPEAELFQTNKDAIKNFLFINNRPHTVEKCR